MIDAVSLIPAPTIRRRRKEHHAKLWTVVCLCVGLLGVAVTAGVRAFAVSPDAVTNDEVAQARAALNTLVVRKEEMLAEAAAAEKTHRAALRAANHPDWSILLAFVSDLCADRVMLTSFTLDPTENDTGFDIGIVGVGRTQNDVANFVLGLEGSGVFQTTRLNGAGGASTEGVMFSATCLIRTTPQSATASAPTEESP